MTKLYKLTDQDKKTRGHTQWGEGVTHVKTSCKHPRLCTNDVIHAYTNANLALLLNSYHANIFNPRLWEVVGKIVVTDWDKVGCFKLTTTKELSLPEWYTDELLYKRVSILFTILCAESVLSIFENLYPEDERPYRAIQAAREYLKMNKSNGAYAAAGAAAHAAAYAAYAAGAAYAAADAAYAAADAADAAYAAAHAAYAAAHAAADAAYAAAHAATANNTIDFGALADQAVEEITRET